MKDPSHSLASRTEPEGGEPCGCPKCGARRPAEAMQCHRCGIVFAKYEARLAGRSRPAGATEETPVPTEPLSGQTWWRGLWVPVTEPQSVFAFGMRCLVWVGFAAWSFRFVFSTIESAYAANSFLHGVNLTFHEAGHILFRPFGQFLTVLGGTLAQLVLPAICAGTLLVKERDAFGASVATWWVAENFMDVAPYVNDARALALPLLGGVTGRDVADYHDWEWMLRKLGLLRLDHGLALAIHGLGVALMVAALAWGALVLRGQARNLEREVF